MQALEALIARLEGYLSGVTGSSAQVMSVQPLAGGASRASWALTVNLDGTPERLVLRMDHASQMTDSALTREQEYRLMQRAHESGVKVARVRFACTDPAVLGQPFFLMDYVDGISIGRKVVTLPELADARARLPEQLADQLARIHAMPVDDLDFLARPAGGDPIAAVLEESRAMLDALAITSPAFEYALRWADRHRPACERVTFIHGDFRIGNILVDADGLAAVIDWEFAHIGDPHEEIGYICMRDWRFGHGHLRLGGIGDRERFITAYESASGQRVDRRAADWWELLGNIRWGIICIAQADRHLSGKDPSVELASLGRRSAEMQYEALRIIQALDRGD